MDRSKLRSLLAKEGVSSDKKASFSEVETQFLTALRELMAATNLPKRLRAVDLFQHGKSVIPIPDGFESLFSDLWVSLRVTKANWGLHGRLDWHYNHPGGGSNGHSIGVVSVENDTLKAGYRLETGVTKEIPPPRFPSDPL